VLDINIDLCNINVIIVHKFNNKMSIETKQKLVMHSAIY